MLKEPHTPEETAPAVHGPEIEPAAKPAKKSRHRTLHCRECGAAFQTMRYDAVYCGSSCREKVKVRERSRAAELYQIAMNWRRDRGRGHDEFADLTKLLDRWIGDDREHQATVGGLHEEPAQEIRQVEHNGKIVGQVERVGREWFWRAKSSAARRDTREQWRNRSNPSHAVPLRFRNRKGVATFATGEAGR